MKDSATQTYKKAAKVVNLTLDLGEPVNTVSPTPDLPSIPKEAKTTSAIVKESKSKEEMVLLQPQDADNSN